MSYVFHPAAEAEYLESIAFFEMQKAGLGASFLADFESIIFKVCAAPHQYKIEMEPDIRQVRLSQFPFSILYRERESVVEILAIPHHRRRPQYWLERNI